MAICGVHMAESLLIGLVYFALRPWVVKTGNFVSGICKLKAKT